VLNWLAAIRDLPSGNYHHDPAVALHLYYPGKGTGKTHLSAGAALAMRAQGKLTVFIEEESYLKRTWAADFADKERLCMLPGESAWLTVIDDLGQNPPAKKESSGAQKAWYDVINRRWLKCGWTIITSNRTLEELMNQGTLSEAAYSRLHQMTRGEVVLMDADDQRLRGVR
jgi:DNA replication protein DnaC